MATIHVSGTQLEQSKPVIPLNQPFITCLALVFLLLMHVFMPNPGGSGLALSFNNTVWAGISLALGIGFYQISTNHYLRYNKFTVGLLIACGLLTLPIAYPSAYVDGATTRLLGLWGGFLLFVVLQQFRFSNKDKQRILEYIVLACLIEALIGYIQYFFLEPGNGMGYNTVANRPYGIFQQPNVMASFLATGLVISGYLLARKNNKYSSLGDTAILYLTPVMTTPLLVVLSSRTGWLGALIGVSLIIPYLLRFSTKRRAFTWIGLVILGVALGFSAAQSQQKSDFIGQKADLESPRRYTFPQTLDMVIEKPFTGWGYGNFESTYTLYTARQHQINGNYPPGLPAMDHPHNETLYWGVEGGIIPLLGLILTAVLTFTRVAQAKKGTRLALLALFVPILLHSQLEYPFYHSAIHWVTLIILLYWLDQRVIRSSTLHFSAITKSLLRISSLIVPTLTIMYMASALHSNHVLTQFERSYPKEPEILERVSNPLAWQDRYNWDIYSTYLDIGLQTGEKAYIQSYIDWSLEIIQHKPRPAFYKNLVLAHLGMGDEIKAAQTRTEGEFLFPNTDFSTVTYDGPSQAQDVTSQASATTLSMSEETSAE
ncbi:PglL family O-oligosaccharyltransferase [Vibrio agarivorans]|uniref:PglL family O-oligosaccharyltransferase n=1 Tax=Vibrio agarivorans TaxID=153622 RepID=UPI00222E9E8D|nr:PglL family O-oligosaccharyltransferase [Vibrio agarivorans]MDN3662338.1 PglL family O-oligosaccharyltransferase [Vibrio agarivorans]